MSEANSLDLAGYLKDEFVVKRMMLASPTVMTL